MPKQTSKLSIKALAIGFCLIIANTFWLVITNEIWYGLHMTLASLFFNAVFSLFALILFNAALRKFIPRYALSQQELLTIYVMIVMLDTLAEHSLIGYLMGALSHPYWFATPENEWRELFVDKIPSWITVSNTDVLRAYFDGDSTFYLREHVLGWLTPLLLWGSFIFALWFVLLCCNVLIRKQWTEREKLSYPIIQLPLEMANPKSRLFLNKVFWIGFAIAALIDIINGLHEIYPVVPSIPVRRTVISRYFTEKPWNAIGYTTISFYPFVIGLTYFVPLDLAFSCWFFHLFSKIEMVIASAIGWRALPGAPYINEQAAGAWLMLGIIAVWATRRHLTDVLRVAFNRQRTEEDADEPMRYRSALIGAVGGTAFLVIFCYQGGMSLSVVFAFLAIYFIMAIGITRVRAEIGPPMHGMVFVNPRQILVASFGTRALGTSNLTMLSFLYSFNRCNRAQPMPNQLEAFKIAERANIKGNQFTYAILFATVVGIIACFWIHMHYLYKLGATNRSSGIVPSLGRESFNSLSWWLNSPRPTDYPSVSFMGIGAIVVIFLTVMRRRFVGWLFHPAGYALGNNTWGGMVYIWFAVFVGWAIKWVILRHGGLKAYRRAIPFFLGLILGEYIIACVWNLIGIAFNMPVIRVWV